MLSLAVVTLTTTTVGDNPVKEAKKVAETFIKVVDQNDAEQLKKIMHPEMVQFVRMDGNLIPFKTADYIQMVADKKLGGTPRKITHQSAKVIRGETVDVVLKAVSKEYDFMYQIALAKSGADWMVVGLLVDIQKAE